MNITKPPLSYHKQYADAQSDPLMGNYIDDMNFMHSYNNIVDFMLFIRNKASIAVLLLIMTDSSFTW